jgi:ABC-type antimicrobial peptide transport system permease subunit
VFVSLRQRPLRYARLLVRTAADPASMTGAVTGAIREVDPGLPLADVRPLAQVVDQFLLPQRSLGLVLVVLGAVALALALFGVYGMMACFVAERTRELAIRMALGATAQHIVELVVGRAGRLVVWGVCFGLPVAALTGWAMRGLLFEVSPGNPLVYGAVVGLVGVVTLAAAWLPARRASRVNPLQAIKAD